MSDPLRGAVVVLAERFGMLPRDFSESVTMAEVVEILATDLTKDKDWREKYERETQIAESKKLSNDQYFKQFKALLKGGG